MPSPPRSLSLPATPAAGQVMHRTGSLPCTGSLKTSKYGRYLKPSTSLDDLDEDWTESSLGSNESLNEGLFSKLKRRLSTRRKSNTKGKRKGSGDSYFLGVLFNEEVGKRLSNSSRDSLLTEFKVELCFVCQLSVMIARLCVRVGTLLTCGEHLHDH